MAQDSTPTTATRRPRHLRHGVVRFLLAANVARPVRRNPVLTIPSFFASWLVGELAPSVLGLWAARTADALRRGRNGSEGTTGMSRADMVGLGLSAAAAGTLAATLRPAARADEELHAAVSTVVPPEHLVTRPRAPRLAVVSPFANGSRRRRRTTDITYGEVGNHELKLDVYEPLTPPTAGQRRPAIVQIHGGAWVVGSKDEQGIPLLNHLAANGWVGFNINYRLSPRAKFPDHVRDCKAALAWVRANADDYGVDPDFVAVTGGSAGGHLTALTALTANDPAFQEGFEEADTSVQAAVPFYGVYDVLDRERDHIGTYLPLMERLVMGTNPVQDPANWESYSPIDRVHPEAPPMMVLHGSSDVLVPPEGARRFVARLGQVTRNPLVYAELTGAQHAFDMIPSIRARHTVEYVERFLTHVHRSHIERVAGPAGGEHVPVGER